MFGGEGTQEGVYELGDIVGAVVAVRNCWSAGRNLKGNCPGVGVFVYFGK